VKFLEVAISGKQAVERPRLHYLKQVARNTRADNYIAIKRMACKKIKMESCQPNKRLKDKKKKNRIYVTNYLTK
jgi:hypothetical protein